MSGRSRPGLRNRRVLYKLIFNFILFYLICWLVDFFQVTEASNCGGAALCSGSDLLTIEAVIAAYQILKRRVDGIGRRLAL